ncbi:hypothetical protein ACFQ0M_03235 [Kitasatospora aburaviensis]
MDERGVRVARPFGPPGPEPVVLLGGDVGEFPDDAVAPVPVAAGRGELVRAGAPVAAGGGGAQGVELGEAQARSVFCCSSGSMPCSVTTRSCQESSSACFPAV